MLTPDTGVLFAPGDVDDLVTQLDKLARDEERLRYMGVQARRWAEENLDPEKYYRDLMAVYTDVAGW